MNNELKHYGVLGMKWGVRRYQNKDGSLTPAGIKRYGRSGTPRYTSWSTKRRQTNARTARELARSLRSREYIDDANYYDNLAKRYEKRAKGSQEFDEAYAKYAKNISVGKAIAGNMLLGPFGYKTYAMARAAGYEKGQAAATAILDLGLPVMPLLPQGISVQRNRIRENYIDGLR